MHALETMKRLNEEAAKKEEKRDVSMAKRLAVKILYYFRLVKNA